MPEPNAPPQVRERKREPEALLLLSLMVAHQATLWKTSDNVRNYKYKSLLMHKWIMLASIMKESLVNNILYIRIITWVYSFRYRMKYV